MNGTNKETHLSGLNPYQPNSQNVKALLKTFVLNRNLTLSG